MNDDNTDDELSKVVGGLEFAIDRQNTDSMVEEKIPVTVPASKPVEEKATEDTEKKPLHQLQSVSDSVCVLGDEIEMKLIQMQLSINL